MSWVFIFPTHILIEYHLHFNIVGTFIIHSVKKKNMNTHFLFWVFLLQKNVNIPYILNENCNYIGVCACVLWAGEWEQVFRSSFAHTQAMTISCMQMCAPVYIHSDTHTHTHTEYKYWFLKQWWSKDKYIY